MERWEKIGCGFDDNEKRRERKHAFSPAFFHSSRKTQLVEKGAHRRFLVQGSIPTDDDAYLY